MPLCPPLPRIPAACGPRRVAAAALLALSLGAQAGPPDANALGRELTPLGGDKAASKDGAIPAWSAEPQATGPFTPGTQTRLELWKHRSEKPLYAIDAANVDQHAGQLSPGQVAVVKSLQGFRMDVYPSHRACTAPDFVQENTRKNVGVARIGEDGWTLKEAIVPGIPFAQPQRGIEVMWNHKLRYRGVGVFNSGYSFLSPRRGASEWLAGLGDQTIFWHWATPGSRKLSEVGNVMSQTYYVLRKPVALAGQGAIISDYFDQPGTDAYFYFPGQRRVRRMPSYAYDAPQIGFENQYAMDETQVFMGALDRFDWKLAGKKELLVPYNSFGAFDFKTEWTKVMTPVGIEPGHRRYELHRVWVVEATVKAGYRHLAPKRTFYVDEDSWNLILAEDYDEQGKLTKVREGYLMPVYETGSCDSAAFSQYNLQEGRVLTDFSMIGAGKDVVYSVKPSNPAMKTDFYTPDNLRALSER